jgi:N-acetylgalactosamine-6-sulfatase
MLRRREFLGSLAAAPRPLSRPNIVLILADDLGSNDLGCYGAPSIRTPRIDALAREGVRFTQAYATPECTPTRTSILTGRYQQRVGGLECAIGVGNVGRYDEAEWLQKRGELGLPGELSALPRSLKKMGYRTALTGKWHLGYERKFWPMHHGFDVSEGILGGNADYHTHKEENGQLVYFRGDRIEDRPGHTTDVITNAALDFLKQQRAGEPFFLYLPYTAPHAPMQPGYRELVEQMDTRVGDVLDQLRRSGLEQNTLVLFLSDNGADANGSNAPLRGKKSSVFEGGIRVAWMMKWPGVLKAGTTFTQPAMTIDLLPTLVPGAGPTDGVDLMPALTARQPLAERTLLWRYRRMKNTRKAARLGDWKLIHDNEQRYLFHLAEDPLEKTNLYAERPAVVKDLEERLKRWEADVRAPRLKDYPQVSQ